MPTAKTGCRRAKVWLAVFFDALLWVLSTKLGIRSIAEVPGIGFADDVANPRLIEAVKPLITLQDFKV